MKETGSLTELLSAEEDPARRLALIDESLRPPEPQLLDTCVLQNLDWVDRQLDAAPDHRVHCDDVLTAELERRFGAELAGDLIAIGTLYKKFEYDGGYPWLVCNGAVEEADAFEGAKGGRVRRLIRFLAGHQEDWTNDAYPGIAHGLLLSASGRPSPLILRALGVSSIAELHAAEGPLRFLPDRGDRLVATYALLSNIPAIVTTDRKTFWLHRRQFAEWGVQLFRPTELLALYEPYWEAIAREVARRQVG